MLEYKNIKIINLMHHLEAIPILATWFFNEWHHLYPERTYEEITRDLLDRVSENKLPLTYIAISQLNEVIGTASLDKEDMDTNLTLSPWIASVYVAESFRGQGIGLLLMKAILKKAKELGFECIYLYTLDKEKWYMQQGWKVVKKEIYRGKK